MVSQPASRPMPPSRAVLRVRRRTPFSRISWPSPASNSPARSRVPWGAVASAASAVSSPRASSVAPRRMAASALISCTEAFQGPSASGFSRASMSRRVAVAQGMQAPHHRGQVPVDRLDGIIAGDFLPERQGPGAIAALGLQRRGAQPGEGAVARRGRRGNAGEALGGDLAIGAGLGRGLVHRQVAFRHLAGGAGLPPAPALQPGDAGHHQQHHAEEQAAVAGQQAIYALGAEVFLHLVEDVGHAVTPKRTAAGPRQMDTQGG